MDASKNVKITSCTFSNSTEIFEKIKSGKSLTGGGCVNLDTPDEKTCAIYASGVIDPHIYNNKFKLCAKIACFKTQVSKNGYEPSYNGIDFKAYKDIVQNNYSYYNSVSSRELIVREKLNPDGTLSSERCYPRLYFYVKP